MNQQCLSNGFSYLDCFLSINTKNNTQYNIKNKDSFSVKILIGTTAKTSAFILSCSRFRLEGMLSGGRSRINYKIQLTTNKIKESASVIRVHKFRLF